MSKYFKTKERKSSDPFGPPSTQKCQHIDDTKALANYTTWLRQRHVVHNKLGEKMGRQSGDLIMNVGDETNLVVEEKRALEYTRIPQKFDKYRGNPEWWEFPPGLHDKCTYRRDKVTYFYTKTLVQKNEIPKIDKVGVPGLIKNEKMLFPRTRNVYRKWQNLNYRKKRIKELSPLLETIEPHKPDFDRLIVVGRNTPFHPEETQTPTTLSRSLSGVREERRRTSVYDSSLKCCLKINGVYFYENSQSLSTSRKFHVLFEYDVQSLPLQTQYIVFENVGRVTIRIIWKKMEKFRLFRNITKNDNTDFFCFDKNMLILVPGQIVNFPIWFRTDKVCTVVETWEINTVPKFWEDTIRVFFVLQAQTHIEHFKERIRNIKTTISQRVKKRIIKEILEDVLKKSKYEDYKTIDYTYHEPDLFEAMNYDDTEPLRTPKYQYDKQVVERLKKFYAEVRQSYHPKTWNLRVWDLQVLARVKDLIEYAEIRTAEFSQYRTMMESKCDLVEEKKSKSNLDMKTRPKFSGSLTEDQSDPFLLKETRYGKLMKILWKMAPPSITLNADRVKYFQVYSILNAYFTLIDSELQQIRKFSASAIEESTQHPQTNCNRLIFEEFDETQMSRTKRSFQEDTSAQPKPEIMRDVSTTDVKKIHQLYFVSTSSEFVLGKTATKQEKNGKKKGKQEDTRMSKSKASQVPSNLSRTTLDEMGLVQLDFDPFEEVLPYQKDNVLVKTSSVTAEKSLRKLGEGNKEAESTVNSLNMFVIIYTYLSKAVDTMVDALESAKEYREPQENIEQLKACFKLFIDDEESETEDQPVNPFTDPQDRDYFENILKAHLNEVTGQYLICGKTEPVTTQRRPVSGWGGEKELVHVPAVPSVFSLYKPEPDEVLYTEQGVQTQPTKEVYEPEAISLSNKDICECPSEYRRSPASPSDMFYFSEDEFFYGQEMQGKCASSKEFRLKLTDTSSEDVLTTVAQKKLPSIPAPSISLLKEWNKKKCSRNDLDELEEMKD